MQIDFGNGGRGMEYFVIMMLFAIGIATMLIRALSWCFWVVLAVSLLSFLLNRIFEATQKYGAAEVTLRIAVCGGGISAILAPILLIKLVFFPWA